MENKRYSLIFFLAQVVFNFVYAESLPQYNFGAAYFLGQRITKQEILTFIQDTRLSDQQKQNLFKKANGQFDQYLKIKNEWLEKHFEQGLRQFLYYQIIQNESALWDEQQSKTKQPKKRLRYTTNQYKDIVNKTEKETLRANDNDDLTEKKIQLGKELQGTNYPHKTGEPYLTTYRRWFNSMKKRIFEELREKEISQFEVLKSQETYIHKEIVESVVNLFYQKIKNELESGFSSPLKKNEALDLVQQHPEWELIISKYQFMSLAHLPLSTYQQDYPLESKFKEGKILSSIDQLLQKDNSEKLQRAMQLAFKFAKKYKEEELQNLIKQTEIEFSEKGDSQSLALNKLYNIALLVQKTSLTDVEKISTISKVLDVTKKSLSNLRQQLSTSSSATLYQSAECIHLIAPYCLQNQLENGLKQYEEGQNGKEVLQKAMKSFVLWSWIREMMQVVEKDEIEAMPLISNYTIELQKKLKAFMQENVFRIGLKKYHSMLEKKYLGQIRLNPNDQHWFYEWSAMNYIFHAE